MEERMLRIEEVAMLLGVNYMTVERWYQFKRKNPDSEYCQFLPDPILVMNSKNRATRFWKPDDVEVLKVFQESVVRGTHGFMGIISNPNHKNKGEDKDGKKKVGRKRSNTDCRYEDAKSAKIGAARKRVGKK